jgi:quercetin dioxygenase-like cupin family protein
MIHHRKTITAAGLALATAIAAASIAGPALATPPVGTWAPVPLSVGSFNDLTIMAEKAGKWDIMVRAKGITDLRVTRVPFAVGSSSGWHSHPGPNMLTVTAGAVVVYEGSDPLCTGRTYSAGQTFSDNGGSASHLVRNESGSVAAEIIAVALYPHGVTPLTDSTRPKPTNCPATVL